VGEEFNFGLSTDTITPGDYDGDGRQDAAVWRPNPTESAAPLYYARQSGSGLTLYFNWGLSTDYATANGLFTNRVVG
jgi:hypothetical protein